MTCTSIQMRMQTVSATSTDPSNDPSLLRTHRVVVHAPLLHERHDLADVFVRVPEHALIRIALVARRRIVGCMDCLDREVQKERRARVVGADRLQTEPPKDDSESVRNIQV